MATGSKTKAKLRASMFLSEELKLKAQEFAEAKFDGNVSLVYRLALKEYLEKHSEPVATNEFSVSTK